MKPLGLTCKSNGELAIIHQCLGCGKIVYNRIAGDDNPDAILALLSGTKASTVIGGLKLLTIEDLEQVRFVLFGKV